MSNGAPPPPPSAPPPYTPPPPAPAPGPSQAASSNEGLPTWAKVAIGCGCAALLIAAALFALLGWGVKKGVEKVQEFENNPAGLIDMMPGLEVVEDNQDAGTITIRNTQTGEVATFDYSDIREGRFSFEGSEGQSYEIDATDAADGGFQVKSDDGEFQIGGSGNLDKVPTWVPRLPDALDTQVAMTLRQGGNAMGTVTQTVASDLPTAADDVEAMLQDAGFTVKRSELTMGSTEVFQLEATQDGRTINAGVNAGGDGQATVTLFYEGPEE
ncbi:MAG: hypothetical protein AAGC60_04500 [Acidobacteriota bacterium]